MYNVPSGIAAGMIPASAATAFVWWPLAGAALCFLAIALILAAGTFRKDEEAEV